MRTFFVIAATILLAACQYDPHAHLITTVEPSRADIVGTYIPDQLYLPPELTGRTSETLVELRADGTFSATNVPTHQWDLPKDDFFSSLLTGTGKWEISKMGQVDPGAHPIWGVYLRDPDNKMGSPVCTGKKPPYGLMFQLGDPDHGYVMILKRKP